MFEYMTAQGEPAKNGKCHLDWYNGYAENTVLTEYKYKPGMAYSERRRKNIIPEIKGK